MRITRIVSPLPNAFCLFFACRWRSICKIPGKQRVPVRGKKLLDRMFGRMLPRGLGKLPLSRMHFGGAGFCLVRHQMASKNLPNFPGLLDSAKLAGIRLVACTMAMEAMGIRAEELIGGVELGGVADYLESAQRTGTNLFV